MPRAGKRAATSEIRADASRRKTSHTPPASPEDIPVAAKSEPEEPLDKYGDLILRVGPGRKSYRVCSRTLARASPVFDAMLYGPSADPRPLADQWTINLPDDGLAETSFFLSISHGQSASVPSALPISALCKLLHLLEKYDAMPVIRPWIQGWLKHVGGNTKDLRLLWISWTAGDSNMFRTVFEKVAESQSIDQDGNLEYDDATLKLFPNDGSSMGSPTALLGSFTFWTAAEITEAIIGTRKALVDAQLDPYWKIIDQIERGKAYAGDCGASVVGSLAMCFVRGGLGTITALKTSVSSYRGTVDNLAVTLKSKVPSQVSEHCYSCRRYWNRVDKPLPVYPEGGIISESHQDRLNARAAETDLVRTERDFWSTWAAAA
ncbi:hypothetical protein CMUS01_11593 [Colletotrichum musicola]|uniref:Nuclear pore protein n=1 Tax=Colletotrichum musicola TaxID=2175873 RepID=A0A8H6JX35_9PEZI|nr:hypothetical protein CMUS01_11593 [Colletotrichum musicola]